MQVGHRGEQLRSFGDLEALRTAAQDPAAAVLDLGSSSWKIGLSGIYSAKIHCELIRCL